MSGHPFYIEMTTTSIEMIRRYNPDIPIRVFFVEYSVYPRPERQFDAFCSRNGVEIVRRPALDKGDYFQENKAWVGECSESVILLLDSDTFIFGDVERVFQKYDRYDVSACRNEWVWRRGYRKEYIPQIGVPLNSGVVLCRNEFARTWATKMPALHSELYEGKRYPELSAWLHEIHPGAYNREEFGFSICAGEPGVSVGHFEDEDCRMSRKDDVQTFQESTLIFHSLSRNWPKYYRELRSDGPRNLHQRNETEVN